jgi:hypothetical protein
MKKLMLLLSILMLGCAGSATTNEQTSPRELSPRDVFDQKLRDPDEKTGGLVGLIHGDNPELGLYVFVFHEPDDFFKRTYFSLVTKDKDLLARLKALRHDDKVRVHGRLGHEDTSQLHIHLRSLEVTQSFAPAVDAPLGHVPVTSMADLEEDLAANDDLTVLVHAPGDGSNMMVEYHDVLMPLYVTQPEVVDITKQCYRGDVLRIHVDRRKHPAKPLHLELKEQLDDQHPVLEVVDAFKNHHDEIETIEGRLVLYPKSTTINRDVWAVEQLLSDGLSRTYTLVDLTDEGGISEDMIEMEKDFKEIWDDHAEAVLEGRNKYINRDVTIRVTGRINVVSPVQANAQIFVQDYSFSKTSNEE